ncbi:MAG: fructose-6-phosphate aldolase [Sphaerochaetaceae bacterium]|nr:fructose-6-phosphate aldolase [Sphaerochaetaceae bacterium]
MEIYLDNSNIDLIKENISWCPITGVTTNPSIIAKENKVNLFEHLLEIKNILSNTKKLHVQVISEDYDSIVKEANKIQAILGNDIYIKIPATKDGIRAINFLSTHGFNITATAIYTTMQGVLSALSGAKYIAIYYNRIENNNGSANEIIYDLAKLPQIINNETKILAASFKNTNQVVSAFANGAQACTVSDEILKSFINNILVEKTIIDFKNDWEKIYGNKNILDL